MLIPPFIISLFVCQQPDSSADLCDDWRVFAENICRIIKKQKHYDSKVSVIIIIIRVMNGDEPQDLDSAHCQRLPSKKVCISTYRVLRNKSMPIGSCLLWRKQKDKVGVDQPNPGKCSFELREGARSPPKRDTKQCQTSYALCLLLVEHTCCITMSMCSSLLSVSGDSSLEYSAFSMGF
jgi:hypothetical protein